jgi:non-ribosomal peptide synthetase component F
MALLPTHEVLPSPEHRDVLFPRTALEQSLADRFGGIARRHADRPAVESADLQLTYGQLDAASDRLGARIAQPHEPTPDQAPVALFLEQGPLFVVAMMATLKAGRFSCRSTRRCPPLETRGCSPTAARDL